MIIKPNKYTNPDLSALSISARILKYLMRSKCLGYDDLLKKIVSAYGEDAKETFIAALNFLFLLKKIDYIKELDSIKINL